MNFAVFARHAERVHLVLSRQGHVGPVAEIPLDPWLNKTGDVWHVFVHDLPPDTLYGYRVFGPFAPHAGHRFNPEVVVLDPYATSISGAQQWGVPDIPNGDGYTRFTRRGRIEDDEFDWEDDMPPGTPLARTVIYELHVRGYTRHPSSKVRHPGTFLGLCEKIPYLQSLGVTAVQLMPVLEFDELDQPRNHPGTGEPLKNYWGYAPLNFFGPRPLTPRTRASRSASSSRWSKSSTVPASRSSSTSSTTTPARGTSTARPSASAAWPTRSITFSTGRGGTTTTRGAATP